MNRSPDVLFALFIDDLISGSNMTDEARKETNEWFDSLPPLTDAEIDEMSRLDAQRHPGSWEI